MPIYRAQVAVAADTVFPRDRTVNTLCFNDQGVGTDADGLAADLAAVMETWYVGGHEIDVRLYDMADAEPREIKGQAIINPGGAPASLAPREVALCLSFYSERNLPRSRGRIYLGVATASRPLGDVRPPATTRTAALALADGFASLGGADVDWCVYSSSDAAAKPVTNAWVDDEWDTMRSRGLRSTTRSSSTPGA